MKFITRELLQVWSWRVYCLRILHRYYGMASSKGTNSMVYLGGKVNCRSFVEVEEIRPLVLVRTLTKYFIANGVMSFNLYVSVTYYVQVRV